MTLQQLQASLNLSSFCEGFSFSHIPGKNAIGISQMKCHYDPDKFIYDTHSLSLERDLYLLNEMRV